MSERKLIKLQKLKIWTDNPRYGKLSEDSMIMSEKDAINLLIDVVGEKKMLNLAIDIINSKGLNANVIPTVVERDGFYYVYDGNRRISSIKIIKDQSIIDSKNEILLNGIKEKIHDLDLSFLNSVFVYVTTEDEALLLMDKTHTGEQDGVGVIPWDAYNRDISLDQRGKNPKYPLSFKIATIMNWTKKKDFLIPYTDLQRLFSSRKLVETFGISEFSPSYKNQIAKALAALESYKQEKGFNSFSRQFNITEAGDETGSDKPINIFAEWWTEKLNSESKYLIRIDEQTTFTDSDFCFDFSKIHIINRQDDSEFQNISQNDLEIIFFDPTGKKKNQINCKIGGLWRVKVFYKSVIGNGFINVKTVALNPTVEFNEGQLTINKGETLNFETTIKYAKTIHENNMRLVSVEPVGELIPIIKGRIFSSENDVGKYVLSFKFDNDGEEYSINKTVNVLPNTRPANNRANDVPFSFYGNSSITFSSDVGKIIDEINDLWITNKYKYVICCSARSVLEMCLEYIENLDCTIFTNALDLKIRIEELASYLLSNKTKLSSIVSAMHLKYKNFYNQILQIKDNAENIASALHLGAHRSASVLDGENLFSKIRAYICPIVQISEGFKLTKADNEK